MALDFPKNPNQLDNNMSVSATEISRTWEYNRSKNRWELATDASLSFGAELPVLVTNQNGQVTHDFDVQDLPNAV